MGLRFRPEANASHYLDLLLQAADANPEKVHVYTHDTMPERYHFSHNERIAPIYVVPQLGYALSHRGEGDVGMSKGVRRIRLCVLKEKWGGLTSSSSHAEPRIRQPLPSDARDIRRAWSVPRRQQGLAPGLDVARPATPKQGMALDVG